MDSHARRKDGSVSDFPIFDFLMWRVLVPFTLVFLVVWLILRWRG